MATSLGRMTLLELNIRVVVLRGHYYDGLQALAFVSAFVLASYAAYRYDRDLNTNYLSTYAAISVTALFHLGNIIGAERTARYYNYRQRSDFMRDIRRKALSIEG